MTSSATMDRELELAESYLLWSMPAAAASSSLHLLQQLLARPHPTPAAVSTTVAAAAASAPAASNLAPPNHPHSPWVASHTERPRDSSSDRRGHEGKGQGQGPTEKGQGPPGKRQGPTGEGQGPDGLNGGRHGSGGGSEGPEEASAEEVGSGTGACVRRCAVGKGGEEEEEEEVGMDDNEEVVDDEEDEKAEGELVMAAGAVLLQAFHAMDRHSELEVVLEKTFGRFSHIPPRLYYMWCCLMVSAGQYGLAAPHLLRLLHANLFKSPSSVDSLQDLATVPVPQRPHTGQGLYLTLTHHQVCVLAGVYAVEVLAKGLGDPAAAADWLDGATGWLPQKHAEALILRVRDVRPPVPPTPKGGPTPNPSTARHPNSPMTGVSPALGANSLQLSGAERGGDWASSAIDSASVGQIMPVGEADAVHGARSGWGGGGGLDGAGGSGEQLTDGAIIERRWGAGTAAAVLDRIPGDVVGVGRGRTGGSVCGVGGEGEAVAEPEGDPAQIGGPPQLGGPSHPGSDRGATQAQHQEGMPQIRGEETQIGGNGRASQAQQWLQWLRYWASVVVRWWTRAVQWGTEEARAGWEAVAAAGRLLLRHTAGLTLQPGRDLTLQHSGGEDGSVGSVGGAAAVVAAVVVVVYAAVKERQAIVMLLQHLAFGLREGLIDAWRLAFSFSLNPLAAAAQVASAPTMVQPRLYGR